MKSKFTILCFVPYYLPGFRSGGPVRTIANIVDHLGDEFNILIVTSDRDHLDHLPYSSVQVDSWNAVGKAQVFYASSCTLNLLGIASLLRDTPHDLLYLNSFFSFSFTTLPLLVCRLGLVSRSSCVVAPRGEFAPAALSINKWKKILSFNILRLLGLYTNLSWHASSITEANHIRLFIEDIFSRIYIASDLPPLFSPNGAYSSDLPIRSPGCFRVVFLSRICPMKNLDFLLRVLYGVSSPLHLSIYGPIDESSYWLLCKSLIDDLPSNISVEYMGEVLPSDVPVAFASADLFALPTRGENFGHVILESLSVGTPVLISDKTPWRDDQSGGLEELSLNRVSDWQSRLDSWATYNHFTLLARRKAALSLAKKFLNDPSLIQSTRFLFKSAISTPRSILPCVE